VSASVGVNPRDKALEVARKLDAAGIWYRQQDPVRSSDAHASIDAAIPGERWEIDILDDGTVEVEVFKTQWVKGGDDILDGMIAAVVEADKAGDAAIGAMIAAGGPMPCGGPMP